MKAWKTAVAIILIIIGLLVLYLLYRILTMQPLPLT